MSLFAAVNHVAANSPRPRATTYGKNAGAAVSATVDVVQVAPRSSDRASRTPFLSVHSE